MNDLELFHVDAPAAPEPGPDLSADQRRTLRQKADVERGRHPLRRQSCTFPDAGTCGECAYRVVLRYHGRSYAKCEQAEMTHGAASDCRAWWPACDRYEPGDRISDDAARWTPGHADAAADAGSAGMLAP